MKKNLTKNLETNRLTLRPVSMTDAPAFLSYWSDPVVTKYMNIERFIHIDQAKEMIAFFQDSAQKDQANRYSIFLKNQIIGSCGFNYLDIANQRTEIGYELGKSFWGHGYMSEVLKEMVNFAFDELKLVRIEAKVNPQNAASIHLLERNGFEKEGLLRQYEKTSKGFNDLYLYSFIQS